MLVLYQRLKLVEAHWIAAKGKTFYVFETPFTVSGESFLCTSGLRSEGQQAELIKAGKTNATKSKHLFGMAADILDEDGSLKKFLLVHPKILEDANLWCEHWEYTINWWHAQTSPPNSGNRWFIP